MYDFSKFTWLFPLKNKSNVYPTFMQFYKYVERQVGRQMKMIQSNLGGEYRLVNNYLKDNGIQHRISCPHTHEHNGLAERKISHVVDSCLTLLAYSGVPKCYWQYAMMTAIFLINRMPLQQNNTINVFSLLYKKKPDYKFLRIFGCSVYPLLGACNI